MFLSTNKRAFLNLVRAGLWENESSFLSYGEIDYEGIYHLAQEQTVVGLVARGIERFNGHNSSLSLPQAVTLTLAREVLELEQRNRTMNEFVAWLIFELRKVDVYALLVKGQGIAQCYERPLWRVCGDVDLLLSKENYDKAKAFLTKIASGVEVEDKGKLHIGMTINGCVVELHGTLFTDFSRKLNKVIARVQTSIFNTGAVRAWDNWNTTIYLPSPDNDVILVFSHILEHFFIEGVGLRQVCDWCRLLWTYRELLDYGLLGQRLCAAGIMSEWKAFASLAVDSLGMPVEAMPFYDMRYKGKGEWVLSIILEVGNFGHNRDLSYRLKYKGVVYKLVSLWRRFCDFVGFTFIFPVDAPIFFITYMTRKVKG